MKMKKYILSLTIAFIAVNVNSQSSTVVIPNQTDSRVITTGVPFLLIASDARAASMGDMGVATSVDTYSQFWNPSKYVFSETKSGFGLSYTPYLSKLVNDISLVNLTYFNRINERSAFAVSLRYFSLGEIELIQDEFSESLIAKPNEMTMDISYSLRLADQLSLGVALRYLSLIKGKDDISQKSSRNYVNFIDKKQKSNVIAAELFAIIFTLKIEIFIQQNQD